MSRCNSLIAIVVVLLTILIPIAVWQFATGSNGGNGINLLRNKQRSNDANSDKNNKEEEISMIDINNQNGLERVVIRCNKGHKKDCLNILSEADDHQRIKGNPISTKHFIATNKEEEGGDDGDDGDDDGDIVITATKSEIEEILSSKTSSSSSSSSSNGMDEEDAIDFIEQDQIRYLAPIYDDEEDNSVDDNDEKHLRRKLQENYGLSMINADKVHNMGVKGKGVKICVIDSGIESNHTEFSSIKMSGIDDPITWKEDSCGHGTHVAGIIRRVAPEAELFIVRTFGTTCKWTWSSNIANAAKACQNNGAHIISMSFGGNKYSSSEDKKFQEISDDSLSISAAGNDGNNSTYYPASYNSCVSVSAVTSKKEQAFFSQWNSQVEITAPGSQIESAALGGGYTKKSGTSIATPFVAGVAALVLSSNPILSISQVRQALIETAADLGATGRDKKFGFGLVDAKAAVDWATAISTAPSPNPTPSPTTAEPTRKPTPTPTKRPTERPTPQPTSKPTPPPTPNPTSSPTPGPTSHPTSNPTGNPTSHPTAYPTTSPTRKPTLDPTRAPVDDPTEAPADPTIAPIDPTGAPANPTEAPVDPTTAPVDPTDAPVDPTPAPVDPTEAPVDPTPVPTPIPTPSPTKTPISTVSSSFVVRSGGLLLHNTPIEDGEVYVYNGEGAAEGLALKQETNGNFCLYVGSSGSLYYTIWCSNVERDSSKSYFTRIQGDGLLKTKEGSNSDRGVTVWDTGSSSDSDAYHLAMNHDGTLSIYKGTPTNRGERIWTATTSLATAR